MPLTDAEREELKTLIRETVREMAKEAGDIMWNTPIPGPKTYGEYRSQLGPTRPNDGSVDPMFGVPIGGPIGGW